MLFNNNNNKTNILCLSNDGKVDFGSGVLSRIKNLITIGKLSRIAISGVAIGAMALVGGSIIDGKIKHDSYPGKVLDQKLSPAQAKEMLGAESKLIAMRFDLENNIANERMIIDAKDTNLADILGSLDSDYIPMDPRNSPESFSVNMFFIAQLSPAEGRYVATFNYLTDPNGEPHALSKESDGYSVCYLSSENEIKSNPGSINNNISGAKFDYSGLEAKIFVQNHEEGHCLDVERTIDFEKEIFADVLSSMMNASVTGNFDMAKNLIVPMRTFNSADYTHQSTTVIRDMVEKVDPSELFGMSEPEVVAFAKSFYEQNPIDRNVLGEYAVRINQFKDIDGSIINPDNEISYKERVVVNGGFEFKQSLLDGQARKDMSFEGKRLLQLFVDKSIYDGTYGTQDSNKTIIDLSSKIARIDGDTAMQYKLQYEKFISDKGGEVNVMFALVQNGVSINYDLIGKREINEISLNEYSEHLHASLSLIKNGQNEEYHSHNQNESNKKAKSYDNDEVSFGL